MIKPKSSKDIKPIKTKISNVSRVQQGDIIKDVFCFEEYIEKSGVIEIKQIQFPLVIVLTQDCDLNQDYRFRNGKEKKKDNQDKFLFSVLVAPLYNADHFFDGKHLELLNHKMQSIKRTGTKGEIILDNDYPRYHYIEFPENIRIVSSVIDFKHYFSVNINYLRNIKKNNFVCKVSELYREQITLRFSNFLSRIGLPD